MSIADIGRFKPNSFDTVIMMGNNFGLFGGYKEARARLRNLHRITSAKGLIIAESLDPYKTDDPVHRAYHRRNRRRRRMSGQVRMRIRHGTIVGNWFDYLLVSQEEMKAIVEGTGWQVASILGDSGPAYSALLRKEEP